MGTKRERQRFGLPFLLYYICSVILIINAMKKFVLFIFTILLYIGSASAQSSNIPLKQENKSVGGSRTVIQLPTATIDGQVLTISFADDADFCVTVTDASGSAVYVGTYTAREAAITLPQLPEGSYYLRIEDEYNTYIGEFEIAD